MEDSVGTDLPHLVELMEEIAVVVVVESLAIQGYELVQEYLVEQESFWCVIALE